MPPDSLLSVAADAKQSADEEATKLIANRQRMIGVASALCVVALFTGFVLVSKAGLRSAMAPLDLLALRYFVAGTAMLPLFLRYRFLDLRIHQAVALSLTGGLGFAAFAYGGFSLAPASHGSSLIHGTLPLTTLLISWLFLREAGSQVRLWGALIISAGICSLVAESFAGIRPIQLLGDGLLLSASVCWSAYGILARRYRVRTIPAAALVAVLSAVLFLPAYFAIGTTSLPGLPWREIVWQAMFQGLAIGVLSLLVYTKAVEILGAANTALFAAAAPATTTLFSIPLLGEQPGSMTWLGVLLVTSGIVVSALAVKRVTNSAG